MQSGGVGWAATVAGGIGPDVLQRRGIGEDQSDFRSGRDTVFPAAHTGLDRETEMPFGE